VTTRKFGKAAWIATAVGAAAAFYVVDRSTAYVRGQLAAHVNVAEIGNGLFSALGKNLAHISFDRPDLIGGGVGALIVLFIVLYAATGRNKKRPGEEHGSARWGTARDIAPMTDRDPAKRFQFTQTESLSIDNFRTQRNNNVCVIGASGTGKSRYYIGPNLVNLGMSKAITDPKGELYRDYADRLRASGHAVRRFNLIDLADSEKFNPMSYFDPAAPETSIVQLVETIMANTTGEKPAGAGDFWERAERALLTALMAYVWATTPESADTEPSLVGVVDLHKEMSASEGRDSETYKSDVDRRIEVARELVDEWHRDPSVAEDQTVMKVLDFACRQYRVFEQGAGETKKSIIISLGVRLSPLDMHDVREILATDTIALDQVGYERTALFLAIPDTHQTFKFIATMFWQTYYSKNIYLADHEKSGRLPIPVHNFLDEFANIGKIPGFPQLMATIRSRGISTSVVVQNIPQGKAMWKDDWSSIVANCDSTLYLGGDDPDTTKWLSGVLGSETIYSEDRSRTYGMNGSWSRSERSMKRELMTPDEIGQMDNRLALLLIRGLPPFRSRKAQAV